VKLAEPEMVNKLAKLNYAESAFVIWPREICQFSPTPSFPHADEWWQAVVGKFVTNSEKGDCRRETSLDLEKKLPSRAYSASLIL
jgi:hypothetical protein